MCNKTQFSLTITATISIFQLLIYSCIIPTLFAKKIVVKNQCAHNLQVSWQTNGETRGTVVPVKMGSSTTFDMEDDWAGRNVDYYDVSFVDGYNLHIRIEPTQMTKDHTVTSDPRRRQLTFCNQIPRCPSDLHATGSSSKFVACQSAYSRYRQDAYCCTGSHASPSTCASNHFARAIKNVAYVCQAPIYTVTFCP
ncbi:thaumatin [Phascolomyces articulosus]|uniref:Thaumatin n=1 Tax=Phascolomyces articulosus TaxID=60185 RepID=A0AAD5PGU6_9FUNG|nr:thaumatin [Phascolomyces articulosus]